jgi:hypothetical protein
MTSPETLHAPGAGLPAFELAYLRIGFRCAFILTSQDAARRTFRREAEKIVSLARSASVSQGAVRVLIDRFLGIEDSSRYWSVFMVLDHLCIVDEDVIRAIEALTEEGHYAQESRIQDVKPNPTAGPDAIDRFVQSVAAYEATVSRLGKLGRDARRPHAWFGPMTARDWHCFAGIRHWVHRRQIERIKKALAQ